MNFRSTSRFVLPIRLGAVLLALLLTPNLFAQADNQTHHQWYQYAVKHVCGTPQPAAHILNDGRYYTAINIHNPQLRRPVNYLYKVTAALPSPEIGPISDFKEASLPADASVEYECPHIAEILGAGPFTVSQFHKGFVVILSKEELDVVAVYTAGEITGVTAHVETLHTERVDPRIVYGTPRGTEIAACYGRGCCCNSASSRSNPNAPDWPDCQHTATECRSLEPGGIFDPASNAVIEVNVCMDRSNPLDNPGIHQSQPAYCRNP